MEGREKLVAIVQKNICVVIKSLLKLKKLNLMKNKQVQNCQEQIQGIFNQLHCERQEDKENFISECVKLMEDGDCDLKECRFLFEDICKMISPVKPEYEYFLSLRKARSMEDFIPGRTNKAPISSKGFGGKTMEHVNKKILMDTGLDSSVALELLIANKIVEFNLPIIQVVE